MKPPPFSYHDPKTVAEVVGLLSTLENAKLLAGGQSLMPMLNFRYVQPDHIIDINRVEGLSYIREAKGALEIGAMTRQRDLEFSDVVRARWPIMHEALLQVGHRQTRNRGTIGGSLCHLDPAAELVSLATGYDATVTVVGPNGQRELPFRLFQRSPDQFGRHGQHGELRVGCGDAGRECGEELTRGGGLSAKIEVDPVVRQQTCGEAPVPRRLGVTDRFSGIPVPGVPSGGGGVQCGQFAGFGVP